MEAMLARSGSASSSVLPFLPAHGKDAVSGGQLLNHTLFPVSAL